MTALWILSLLLSLAHLALALAGEDTANTPRQITDAEEGNLAGMLNPPVWPTQASVVLPARTKMVVSPPVPMGRLTPTLEDLIWKDTTDEFRGIIGEYADMADISEGPPSSFPGESQREIPGSTDKGMTSQTDVHPPPGTSARDRDPHFTQAPGRWTTKSNTMSTLGQNPWTLPVMQKELPDSSSSHLPSSLLQTGRSTNSNSSTLPSTGMSSKGQPTPSPSKPLLLTPPMTNRAKPPVDQSATIKEEPGALVPMLEDTGKGFDNFSKNLLNTGSVSAGQEKGRSSKEEWSNPETNATSASPDWNADSLTTPSNTSDQPLTSVDPDDITSKQSLRPLLVLTPPLFVPLYSDWNSAMATWGLAWEAHVYGLGSVFAVFGLISILCLLGLPLRCPTGSPYFTVLHLLLLATGGVRAFSLLYDAYSHQDRLPLLGSLLLSELPLACLTSAFSLSFILLSQRSRLHLSLRLSLSAPWSPLPRPWLLLSLSLLHFGASLGSVGLLQLFPSLPALLLLPQGLFVSLCLLLSCSYLIFYCHVRADTTHIYQLRDTGEEGGSPVIGPPARCPFSEVGEWGKAAGAGVGAALCLLGCGGLQLYGILHALGLGGVSAGAGFQPWPWWGYQMGCRLCEVGVCLSLSLIGAQPLLCHTSASSRVTSNPRPGSWSRLPSVSPSKGSNLSPQAENKSPNLPPHYPWALSQQEKLVVCEVITKSQSEDLPLYSLAEPPQNGPGLRSNSSHTRSSIPPLLPDPPSPPGRPGDGVDLHASLDNLTLYSDSTVDLRPPSPIDLSRSIDQALFSETLFPHSLFSPPRLFHASSSFSLTSPSQGDSYPGSHSASSPLYRTSSCGDVDQNDSMSRFPQPDYNRTLGSPDPCGWKGSNASSVGRASLNGSSQGLCSSPIDKGKSRFCPRATGGQHLSQSSLPRTIPHLPHHRHYRTLSSASQHSQGEGRLAGTEHLSESRQLERDLAVQAEFINVCRQIDSLSVCSDTIDL